MKISKQINSESFFSLLGNAYTFKLKNHQIVKLNRPYIKDWQWIFSKVWQKGPPPGPDRDKTICPHTEFSNYLLDNKQLK